MTLASIIFALLGVVAVSGAVVTVFARDVSRMAMGLGAFLLAVAGFFVYWGATFLGVVQLFVYIGGVLVLMIFAIMLVHRSPDGSPLLETRHDVAALAVAGGLFFMVVMALRGVVPDSVNQGIESGPAELTEAFLGPMLTHFEMGGVLLLAVLVSVVVILGGDDR
ncbi:MAG: NADH-quinone oxidoreductase subunit J [Coriobacteriia bacterium]|nr:NADH-quinone oxidoreductase subunit J [Coriobacteriia bacterium]